MSTAKPGRGAPIGLGSVFVDPYEPEYPSSDGNPMAESTLQAQWITTIKEGIVAVFDDRDDVFVAADLLWYATQHDKTDVIAPDVLVAFGRPRGHRRSYREWVEEGVVPQVVFEIDSPSNTPAEMARKLAIYDRRGVEEYYYYDPESGSLEGWIRERGGLQPIGDLEAWRSPRLGVTFKIPRRKDALIVRGPDGKRFRTFIEVKRDADAARRLLRQERSNRRRAERLAQEQAEQAEMDRQLRDAADQRAALQDRRADAEHERAEAERQRAERLAAMLREMGVDPD